MRLQLNGGASGEDEGSVLDIATRPAHSGDIGFLSDVFLSSMREWITSARGFWDVDKERAQFRQQLEVDNTRVIQTARQDIGFVMARRVSFGTTEVHTLCIANSHQGAGIGTLVMHDLMRRATASGTNIELTVLKS